MAQSLFNLRKHFQLLSNKGDLGILIYLTINLDFILQHFEVFWQTSIKTFILALELDVTAFKNKLHLQEHLVFWLIYLLEHRSSTWILLLFPLSSILKNIC